MTALLLRSIQGKLNWEMISFNIIWGIFGILVELGLWDKDADSKESRS